jgi:tRNA dimethylallyltransferase
VGPRTRAMFEEGLVDETRAIVARGQGEALRSLRAVGYDEALELIEGRIDRAEAEERTSRRTLQLAKRQRTWFRHQIAAARLDADEEPSALAARAMAVVHDTEH